ncbi:ABC transporter permease [Synechococcus sp. PCC 7336]|uniref:ABC transporter permease n=1 Tax=Synechococcus sp. PCC 7336 TaxID=195250 RepID=UPI0003458D80|nr:ABC transporter permease [Synechococcus sp. PCC 7336]
MNLAESFSMSIATLTANKLRSTLTMLGIVIGNASVIALVGLGEGAQNYVQSEIEGLGPNILFALPGNTESQRAGFNQPKTLVLADAVAIAEQVPSVVAVAPEYNTRGVVSVGNRSSNTTIVGTTDGFPLVRNFDVARGRFVSELDLQRNRPVAVLGSELADRMFDDRNPLGTRLRINNVSFEVIGVLAGKGSSVGLNYDEVALVPITTMSSRLVGQTSPFGIELTYVSASIADEESMRAAEFQIANLLRLRHKIVNEDDFVIRSQKTLLAFTDTVTGALTLLLAAIAGISLFVGGIGIMNIMLVSVKERTQEIGLRKAIGASQQDILVQFTIESVLLAVIGGGIGVTIGVSGLVAIGIFAPFNPGISLVAIAGAVGVSSGIGLIFGVIPARQAAKLDPIVALRTA